MSTTAGTFEQVARAMIDALAPLRRALGSTDAFQAFMLRLGWDTVAVPPAYTQLSTAIADAIQPDECIFLDDLGINLKPAAAMGMTTIKVLTAQQAITDLSALLGFA